MIRKILIFVSIISSVSTFAQDADTAFLPDVTMDEIVISASKFKEQKKNVAQYIQTIPQKEIEWMMPQTSATLLEQTGKVFVQRSQAGGGSPVIRGFEANKVLLVIDGVRMNNAIYRGGHLQNVITVDNNMLEAVEILHGPGSTLYGSDALGGVMLFRTKQPRLSWNETTLFKSNIMTRFSSANNEATGHIDFNIGGKNLASLTSITYSKFGDTRQGNIRSPYNDSFGKRQWYVERIDGTDRVIYNQDANIQKFTGYSQVDLMQKFLLQQGSKVTHTLNLQYSTSSDVARYDRLTDIRNGNLRYAEWYYGPQDRAMAAYHLQAKNLNGFFDEVSAGINYQYIKESRHQRLLYNDIRQNRTERLNIGGYNIDLRKMMNRHELTIGTDGQYNDLRSTAFGLNIATGQQSPLDTRYPDGGSNMYYGAVYAAHIFKIIPDKLILNDGIRLNYVGLNATFDDTTFYNFPFRSASQDNTALSGNLGLVYMPQSRWRFVLNGSTGFRSPNIDDLGKVFDSRGGEFLVVPNPDLQPEYSYNTDLGISYSDNKFIRIEATGFHTWLRNAIVQDFYTLNGQTTLPFEGVPTRVVANQNKASAYIYGINSSLTAKLTPRVTFYSTLTYTYGRYEHTGTNVPLDHIPPVYGKTSIFYRQGKFEGEFYSMYNGWKRLKDYSPSGEDNLNYATPLGMPSWNTLNIRTAYNLNDNMSFHLALENILDKNYRNFASGVSAPGRNLVLTFRGTL